jgi:hypothetical protein
VYAAAARGHSGCGIEINPVGWIYGAVKLTPASEPLVLRRLTEITSLADSPAGLLLLEQADLPEFFDHCFASRVRRFLITARAVLKWRSSRIDRTLMALILVYLHGKRGRALSNQMRDSKAMAPDYSVAWWQARALTPPDINPHSFLADRIAWRYRKGRPQLSAGRVVLGDSTTALRRISRNVEAGRQPPFSLLFTSPPYCGVTNYHYDQWLRLWMLGGRVRPAATGEAHRGKFESHDGYRSLLDDVFGRAAQALRRDAVVYVRTDARKFTLETTLDVLTRSFPRKRLKRVDRPLEGQSQTSLYGDHSSKPGEVDLVLNG